MKNFNRGNRSGRGGGSRRFDSNRGGGMHQAVCDECGKPCQVPFRPTGDKPIYCDACFGSKKDSPRRSDRRDFGGRDSGRSHMHQATCDQCGKVCEVPFRPTSGKPIYCDDCFGSKKDKGFKRDKEGDKGSSQLKDVLNSINAKLDKILKVIAPKADQTSTLAKEVVDKKTPENKPTKEKEKKEAKPRKTEPKKKIAAKKITTKKSTIKKTTAKKKK